MNIKWNCSREEHLLITKISQRAFDLLKPIGKTAFMNINMDITACHLNGNPLKLNELLDADDFNFLHDICGIEKNICRETGKLKNCFLPRFSK